MTTLFPLWAVLLSVLAYVLPECFAPLRPAIVPLLGVVMLGMGMTLTASDFAGVVRRPGSVLLGVGMQYALMPFIAWLLARVVSLPPAVAAGLVLVGCCPGGTASNVVCYLARGDVALSITLTSVSTLIAFLLTPAFTWLYIGRTVSVPVADMTLTILKIVIVPVVLGVCVNTVAGSKLDRVRGVFPFLSVISIVLIIAIIVAVNRPVLLQVGAPLLSCVVLHNLLGLASGYGLARLLRRPRREARTLAIEVGMQNSGLGVALAIQYFSPVASLPGAIFSIWHNVSGSFLAGIWSRTDPRALSKVSRGAGGGTG